jgi:hypothetical protein
MDLMDQITVQHMIDDAISTERNALSGRIQAAGASTIVLAAALYRGGLITRKTLLTVALAPVLHFLTGFLIQQAFDQYRKHESAKRTSRK